MTRNNQPLEKQSTAELIRGIHALDAALSDVVHAALPAITALTEAVISHLENGGRLFYLGAGTSGRLGILDASECPPTYGVPHELVNGIIAGGDTAIRRAVEFAEDDIRQGYIDLQMQGLQAGDMVIGISASGSTPYVLGALQECRRARITTGAVCCKLQSMISDYADFPVELDTGPEFVLGSTRMKAGTATKMVLNMITTTTMIRLGKVMGVYMVDMQLSNNKLLERGTRMIMNHTGLDAESAGKLLLEHGNVRKALHAFEQK
jgi:N-acetylmuramic acid 6-phosphate etherase